MVYQVTLIDLNEIAAKNTPPIATKHPQGLFTKPKVRKYTQRGALTGAYRNRQGSKLCSKHAGAWLVTPQKI